MWHEHRDDSTCCLYPAIAACRDALDNSGIYTPFLWCRSCFIIIEKWCPCETGVKCRCRLYDFWKNFVTRVFPEGTQSLFVGTLSIFYTSFGAAMLCLPWCCSQMGVFLFVVSVWFVASATSMSLDTFIDEISAVELQNCLMQEALRESVGNSAAAIIIFLTLIECLVNIIAYFVFAINATTPLMVHQLQLDPTPAYESALFLFALFAFATCLSRDMRCYTRWTLLGLFLWFFWWVCCFQSNEKIHSGHAKNLFSALDFDLSAFGVRDTGNIIFGDWNHLNSSKNQNFLARNISTHLDENIHHKNSSDLSVGTNDSHTFLKQQHPQGEKIDDHIIFNQTEFDELRNEIWFWPPGLLDPSPRPNNLFRVLVAIGLISFIFCCQPVLLALQMHQHRPTASRLKQMKREGFLLLVWVYLFVGLTGYCFFGGDVRSDFMLSLVRNNNWFLTIVRWLMIVVFLIGIPLNLQPARLCLWDLSLGFLNMLPGTNSFVNRLLLEVRGQIEATVPLQTFGRHNIIALDGFLPLFIPKSIDINDHMYASNELHSESSAEIFAQSFVPPRDSSDNDFLRERFLSSDISSASSSKNTPQKGNNFAKNVMPLSNQNVGRLPVSNRMIQQTLTPSHSDISESQPTSQKNSDKNNHNMTNSNIFPIRNNNNSDSSSNNYASARRLRSRQSTASAADSWIAGGRSFFQRFQSQSSDGFGSVAGADFSNTFPVTVGPRYGLREWQRSNPDLKKLVENHQPEVTIPEELPEPSDTVHFAVTFLMLVPCVVVASAINNIAILIGFAGCLIVGVGIHFLMLWMRILRVVLGRPGDTGSALRGDESSCFFEPLSVVVGPGSVRMCSLISAGIMLAINLAGFWGGFCLEFYGRGEISHDPYLKMRWPDKDHWLPEVRYFNATDYLATGG